MVENINGLIRRFFPKGTDFDTISEEQIAYVEDCRGKCKLESNYFSFESFMKNNRPIKILNYMTPKQKLQYFSVAIASCIHQNVFIKFCKYGFF